jgi:phosphatidylglycerophosphate synthase
MKSPSSPGSGARPEDHGIVAGNATEFARSSTNRPMKEYYSAARGALSPGFLYSRTVCERLGSGVAAFGMRIGAHPTYLTLANLVLGVGGSVAVITGRSSDRISSGVIAGVVLWQLAYIFDCADGQLARATGKTSSFGVTIDVLVDVAVQISLLVAVSGILLSRREIAGLWVVLFASSWFIGWVTFLLRNSNNLAEQSLLPKDSIAVSIVKLSRDYGFILLVFGVWIVASPSTLYAPVLGVMATNLAVLSGRITKDATSSIRKAPRLVTDEIERINTVPSAIAEVESAPL